MKQIIIFIILFLFSACRFIDTTEEIEIHMPSSLPEIPEEGDFFWELNYRGSGGAEKVLKIHREVKKLNIFVDKGYFQPFVLSGIINGGSDSQISVLPAGFIYSISSKTGGQYNFEWELGFESRLLLQLMEFIDIEKINVFRLLSCISEVAENNSHWVIDNNAIIENMIPGNFRVYDIREKRERVLSLFLPGGIWFNTNPLGNNIISISASQAVEVSLRTGFSMYYNKSGTILEVDLESNGDFDYIIY